MTKIIDEGAFRAEVDASDLDNVKLKLTMIAPLYFSEYDGCDPWYWENDIALEARFLRENVHDYVNEERLKRRCKLYAV